MLLQPTNRFMDPFINFFLTKLSFTIIHKDYESFNHYLTVINETQVSFGLQR